MADQTLSDAEKKIVADLQAARKASKRSRPLSRSFADRMTSSVADPRPAQPERRPQDGDDTMVIRA